jgi:hypothetical protein
MTQDEIIEMAKEVGLGFVVDRHWMCHKELEDFAKLVAAKEREACEKVADGWSKRDDDVGAFIGKAIRARGEV